MFNSMLNYTSPTAHLEQRRGVVDGGSVVARNRVMNASLWSIVPPSVSAGCGGIDMFAGSFSFISGAQFQQLMRSIAANAPGYAFEVALEAMCPSCMQTMESLQRKLQELSSGMVNSCQLAKGFVNDVADAFDVAHKDKTSLIADTQGWVSDTFQSRTTTTGNDSVGMTVTHMTDEQRGAADLQGNLVWQALKRRGAAGWFASGDDDLLEAIMSITGSVIVGSPTQAPDGKGQSYPTKPLPGNLMKVADLLWGSRSNDATGTGAVDSNHVVLRYRCDARGENQCLAPTPISDTALIGLVQYTKKVLVGDPQNGGSGGLIDKFRYGTEPVTAAEMAFMQFAPNGVAAQLHNLSRYNAGIAANFADEAAPVIALEMAKVMIDDLVRAAENAMVLQANTYAKEALAQIKSAKEQVHREYEVVAQRYGNVQTVLAHYEHLVATIKGKDTTDASAE